MPSLLLVRHGQASFGGDDYDLLSELGREQAAVVKRELERRGIEPATLGCGSLRRQRETAAPWDGGAMEVREDERWDEYDAATVLAGAGEEGVTLERPAGLAPGGAETHAPTPSEFQRLLDGALAAWVGDEGGASGERWPAFRERVVAAARDALASLPRGGVGVVFTSGGPIAAACVECMGLPDSAFVRLNRVLVNGGITKLIAGGSGVTLSSFNEHAHLEPDLVTYR